MVKEFTLPEVGEGIEHGDVVQVLVSEGDVITEGKAVLELETEKAVVEVSCPYSGRVTKIHVRPGDRVPVGATLLSVDTEAGESAPAGSTTPPAGQPSTAEPTASTEDAAAPVPVRAAQPAATKPAVEKPKAEPATAPPLTAASASPGPQSAAEPVPAGPATRRLARELGVDLAAVAGAYPGVRLTEEHIKEFVRSGGHGRAVSTAGAPQAPPLPDFAQWGPIERIPFSSLQRKTAEHLRLAWATAPHVTQFDSADITSFETFRQRFRQTERGKEVRLTVTAVVLKAVVSALKAYPQFNASFDAERDELILKRYYHIGVAVDTDAGLIVPVLRDVDRKSVMQLAIEMNEMAERTRQRKVGLDELRGGTFTVTNLGGIGGTAFAPILNYPEVAILGLARSREEPVVREGRLGTRLMLPLCLSYDHRVINGADGARFIRKVATMLENYEWLLMEG